MKLNFLTNFAQFALMSFLMGLPNTSHAALTGLWDHELANTEADTSGNGNDLINVGGVPFASPISPGNAVLGNSAANFTRNAAQRLDIPGGAFTGGTDSFTYSEFERKNNDESGGHQTILSSNRFRFQYRDTGGVNGAGTLRLDVNGAGASGAGESGDNTFATEDWLFTALSYDAGTQELRAYQVSESAVQFGNPLVMTRTANGAGLNDISGFHIGRDLSGIGGADGFGGQIDASRFWDSEVRSVQQLRDTFNVLTGRAAGPLGKVAQYTHEGTNPLADSSGNGLDATTGGVSFVAPPGATNFDVGNVVGQYDRGTDALDVPVTHTPGDSFTFAGLIRKNNDESGGHQTILSSDQFRFQYRDTGGADGLGTFRLDINGAGTVESGDGTFAVEEWQWVALRYDANTDDVDVFAFDDSSLDPSMIPLMSINADLSAMSQFRVGADGLSGIGGFDSFGGWIDGATFWDVALSDAELTAVFQNNFVPEPASILVWTLLGIGMHRFARHRRKVRK
jgi:hypothetical protein